MSRLCDQIDSSSLTITVRGADMIDKLCPDDQLTMRCIVSKLYSTRLFLRNIEICIAIYYRLKSKIFLDLEAECNTEIGIFNLQFVIVLQTKLDQSTLDGLYHVMSTQSSDSILFFLTRRLDSHYLLKSTL